MTHPQVVTLALLNVTHGPTTGHLRYDIIYSFEAVGPVGVVFNLRDAFAGNLISAHRFMSIEEMVFERLVVECQYISESSPLPLGNREKRALLIESLLRSHRAGMAEPYYLISSWLVPDPKGALKSERPRPASSVTAE